MEKVAPSERFRRELDEVLAGVGGEEDPIETVGRLGARLILQQALEDEVTEFLGCRRYERAGETVSHRNGHEPRTVKTTSGAMRLERPRIRDAGRLGFESRILGKGVARTHARQLHHQPVFEHHPREAQMTPHAQTRQVLPLSVV
jgi:putative transposase